MSYVSMWLCCRSWFWRRPGRWDWCSVDVSHAAAFVSNDEHAANVQFWRQAWSCVCSFVLWSTSARGCTQTHQCRSRRCCTESYSHARYGGWAVCALLPVICYLKQRAHLLSSFRRQLKYFCFFVLLACRAQLRLFTVDYLLKKIDITRSTRHFTNCNFGILDHHQNVVSCSHPPLKTFYDLRFTFTVYGFRFSDHANRQIGRHQ